MNEIRKHPLQHPYFENRVFGNLSDLKQIFTEDEIDMLIDCGYITIHSSTCANNTDSTCANKFKNFIKKIIKNYGRLGR